MALSAGIKKFTQVSDQDGLIALINTKQPKGNYLQIDSNDLIALPSNVITRVVHSMVLPVQKCHIWKVFIPTYRIN